MLVSVLEASKRRQLNTRWKFNMHCCNVAHQQSAHHHALRLAPPAYTLTQPALCLSTCPGTALSKDDAMALSRLYAIRVLAEIGGETAAARVWLQSGGAGLTANQQQVRKAVAVYSVLLVPIVNMCSIGVLPKPTLLGGFPALAAPDDEYHMKVLLGVEGFAFFSSGGHISNKMGQAAPAFAAGLGLKPLGLANSLSWRLFLRNPSLPNSPPPPALGTTPCLSLLLPTAFTGAPC